MDKIEEIRSNLTASKSSLRRSAAKYIGKNEIATLGKPLWDEVLGEDKMMPSVKEIAGLLDYVSKFAIINERGYTDFRIGLVCACAGWRGMAEITLFLNECLKEEDSFFVKVAVNALKGKYTEIS